MVILNPAQQALVDTIASLKNVYEAQERQLKADYEVRKNTAKDPVRKAVAEALAAGVPARQIHINGLGFAQVGSMHNWLAHPVKLSTESLLALSTQLSTTVPLAVGAAEPYKPVFRDNRGEVSFEDSTGKTFKQAAIQIDGKVRHVIAGQWEELSEEAKQLYMAEFPYHLISQEEFDGYVQGLDPERWDYVK